MKQYLKCKRIEADIKGRKFVMSKEEVYFYFSRTDKKLCYGDNRKIRKGVTHGVCGDLKLCKNGLHASRNITDALQHAPGCYLWLVTLSEKKLEERNKICARSRTYIEGFNAEKVLKTFARQIAMVNIEKIKPYCGDTEYQTIVKWLETGDEDMRSAARSAARSATWSAVRSAVWSAAESAARSAAESAAGLAAEVAARSAARLAARSAVRSATWSAVQSVVWSAVRSAAESAAESDAEQMLIEMLPAKIKKHL